jgi:hypothetical protein
MLQLGPDGAEREAILDLLSLTVDYVLGANPAGSNALEGVSPGIWKLEAPLLPVLSALLPEARSRAALRATATLVPPTPALPELAGAPVARLRGMGRHWARRAERAGVRTIGELAGATAGPDLRESSIRIAREALELARLLEIPPDLGGLRCGEVLSLPLSEDESVTRCQVGLQDLLDRLERRWFWRLRALRIRG